MKMKYYNLIIELKDFNGINYLNWESIKNEIVFSFNFKSLNQIKLVDDVVLHLKFENGDLRLDITKSELKNLIK